MKVTIIEDEKILAAKTAIKLKKKWFSVEVFNSFHDFKDNYTYKSDLYLIDLSLWDWNGFDLIKWLREIKLVTSPIMITSWYNDDEKKIYWLDIWADDYLAKPYSPEILLARIRALIRRSYKVSRNSNIKYKNLIYSIPNKTLTDNWVLIDFTAREMQLVEFMLFNLWKLITKSEIISSVWWDYEISKVTDNTINVTISKVRKKLWKDFHFQTLINKWYILEK